MAPVHMLFLLLMLRRDPKAAFFSSYFVLTLSDRVRATMCSCFFLARNQPNPGQLRDKVKVS